MRGTMKQRNWAILLMVLTFTLFLAGSAALAAPVGWDSSEQVRRLYREAPTLASFSGAPALVWLDNNYYRMRADGAMERTHYMVVMVGERVPEQLKRIVIPVPRGGEVQVLEAAWYNPMTAMKEGRVSVDDDLLPGGAAVKRISVQDEAVGRAVVIVTHEVHPAVFGISGLVAMAGPLPRWEQRLTAEVLDAQELFWTGRDAGEPLVTKDGRTQKYTWNVMNQQPWYGEGFIEYHRPFVAFGVRKGIGEALALVERTPREMKTPPLPSFAKAGDKAKNGLKLMDWVAEPSRTLKGYPQNWVRPNELLPDDGPWMQSEQTLILGKWLEMIGWQTELWWQAGSRLSEETPAAREMFLSPVLQLRAASGPGKMNYYQAAQAASFGSTTPAITASTLYRTNDKEIVESATVSHGSASDHKLSMLWRMRLDENGTASGTLDVTVNGGWTELLTGGQLPPKEELGTFLEYIINFAMPGLELSSTSISTTNTGYKLDFTVTCAPGIVHDGNLLLRLPGGVPQRLGEMIGQSSDYVFRFPFIIEQKVRLRMPPRYRLVQQPSVVNYGEGTKAILKQSITHWPKKATLEADSVWTVKTRAVDSSVTYLLREELAAILRWPVLNLPFRR